MNVKLRKLLPLSLFILIPGLLSAQDVATIDTGDTAWMIVACALVLFMTLPGLALFYGGLVRAKNVLSVLMHCMVVAGVMSQPGLFRGQWRPE